MGSSSLEKARRYALHLPFEDAAFDTVFLQHVAMNIEDRMALYAEARRVLTPGGRFVTYDLVLRDGDVVFPPHGHATLRPASCSPRAIRARRLNEPGSRLPSGTMTPKPRSTGSRRPPPARIGNLARKLRKNRLGVLSAVLTHD
jgi:SAM-dependent methyltransferase